MKNNKFFERTPRDRDEKRRLLFNKKYEIRDTLYNDTETAPANAGAAEGVMSKAWKMNRRIIALVLAVVFVLTSVVVGINIFGKADDAAPHLNDGGIRYNDSNVTDIEGLHLNKTVTYLDDDTYNVKLEAYAEANTIKQPITDIVMTLDTSKRMETELYTREYKNLNTHTLFVPINSSDATYNHMHDADNIFNSASIDVSNSYSSNKYVMDPNTPGVYVYLASRYYIDFAGDNGINTYEYTFTDSLGNTYRSDPISKSVYESVTQQVSSIHFNRIGTKIGDAVDSVDISDFYQRNNAETNALTKELVKYAGTRGTFGNPRTETRSSRRSININIPFIGKVELIGADTTITLTTTSAVYSGSSLWIYSDSGERLPVTITEEKTHYSEVINRYNYEIDSKDYTSSYVFTAVDNSVTPNKVYRAVQGNSQYGADFGVFQGFKVYKYLKATDPEAASMVDTFAQDNDGYLLDEHGERILVVDHSQSIESKSLYTSSTGESVTRMQAMKEEAESFITQLHVDAFQKNPNLTQPNARLSVITYGVDATTLCELPDVNLSNEVESIKVIDRIYALSPADRNASQLDEAMAAVKKQFDDYSKEEPNHKNHKAKDNDFGEENKKISILFSSGVPSKETYKFSLIYPFYTTDNDAEKELNQSVADSAIATANAMKNDLGVLSYTVGLYNGASTAARNKQGYDFYYGASLIHQNVHHNGEIGKIWGSTDFSDFIKNLTGGKVADVDIPATNRVMDYISSNFSDVEDLGLQRKTNWNPRNYILSAGGTGYKILSKPSPTSEGHFFAIDFETEDEDALENHMQDIFDQIATSIEIPSTTLGEEDLLIDYVTDSFNIIDDPETLKAYMMAPTNRTDPEHTTWSIIQGATLAPTVDGNKVSVNGFDYMTYNMLNQDARKLVLEFNIQRKDGLIGGNNIPTNTSMAGIYDVNIEEGAQDAHSAVLEEAFRIPYVDLVLKDELAAANDASVYYGSAQNLEVLIDKEQTDGFKNQFVKIEYQVWDGESLINTYVIKPGDATGEWVTKVESNEAGTDIQNLETQYPVLDKTKDYTIKMIVHPEVRTGTLEATTMTDSEGNEPTATVYVFTPHVDVHNDTITEATDYNLTKIPSAVTWETKAADGSTLTEDQLAAAEALLPTEIDEQEVEHRVYPDTTITIITTDEGKPSVTETNQIAYPISEERHFKVSEIKVEPLPFIFEAWQPVRYADEYDQDGNVTASHTEDEYVTHFVNIPNPEDPNDTKNRHTWQEASATYDRTASYTNISEGDGRVTGDFTIFFGYYFDMSIDKHFTGGFANLQKVTITATPIVNNTPVEADAKSVSFDVSDFNTTTYEANTPKTISDLEADKTYLITETFDAGDGEKAKYKVLYTVTENNIEVADADNDLENKEFKLVKGNNDKTVSVLVTNEANIIPPTGYSDNTDSSNVLLIALAATATLAAGGYGVYRVYRPRKES